MRNINISKKKRRRRKIKTIMRNPANCAGTLTNEA
jgi:hypothetical protein